MHTAEVVQVSWTAGSSSRSGDRKEAARQSSCPIYSGWLPCGPRYRRLTFGQDNSSIEREWQGGDQVRSTLPISETGVCGLPGVRAVPEEQDFPAYLWNHSETQLSSFHAVGPWASCLASLRFSFLACGMSTTVLSLKVCFYS